MSTVICFRIITVAYLINAHHNKFISYDLQILKTNLHILLKHQLKCIVDLTFISKDQQVIKQ